MREGLVAWASAARGSFLLLRQSARAGESFSRSDSREHYQLGGARWKSETLGWLVRFDCVPLV